MKIIKTNASWEIADIYLDLLRHIGLDYDEEFQKLYLQLADYVYSKIALPDCEIVDEYHVYEVILPDPAK